MSQSSRRQAPPLDAGVYPAPRRRRLPTLLGAGGLGRLSVGFPRWPGPLVGRAGRDVGLWLSDLCLAVAGRAKLRGHLGRQAGAAAEVRAKLRAPWDGITRW